MSRRLASLASKVEASSVVTPISACRHYRRNQSGPVHRARWGCLSVNRRGRPSCGGLLTFRLLPKAPRRKFGRAARPLAVSSPAGPAGKPQNTQLRPLWYSYFASCPGCSQAAAASHSQVRGALVHETISSWSASHRGPFSSCRARRPNPSIERTCLKPLRAFSLAAHVKR